MGFLGVGVGVGAMGDLGGRPNSSFDKLRMNWGGARGLGGGGWEWEGGFLGGIHPHPNPPPKGEGIFGS